MGKAGSSERRGSGGATATMTIFIEHGTAGLRSEEGAAGRRFVDAVARWLDLELDDETAPSRPLRDAAASGSGDRTLDIHGAISVEVPEGWSVATTPDAKHRLTDAGGERWIELWHSRSPIPLPNDEDLLPRLRTIIEESGYRELATPVETFVQRGAAFAWSEIASNHRDPARPTFRGRPFRVRLLAAGAASAIVMVTGKWPASDASAAEAAWRSVIDSLRFR